MVFRGRPCSAPDCCNKKVKGNKNGIFFYTLPTDEKLSKKWLANLRIDKKIPRLYSKNYLVCWKHFEPDCFDRDFRAELLGEKRRAPLKLKKGSIPTLFQYNNFQGKGGKKRVLSEERRRKKDKEEMLKDMLGPYHDMKLIPPDHITEVNEDEYFGEYTIQSLLPNFSLALENEEPIDHDYARKPTEGASNRTDEKPSNYGGLCHQSSSSLGVQTTDNDSVHSRRDAGTSVDNDVNNETHTDNEEPSSSHGDSLLSNTDEKSGTTPVTNCVGHQVDCKVSTDSTSNNGKRNLTITHRVNCETLLIYNPKTSQFEPSISRRIKHGRLIDISCQTVTKRTTEISCLAKPCLVSVATQWDEKDFLPDPEVIERDHAYVKKMRVEVNTVKEKRDMRSNSRGKTKRTRKR